MNGTADAGGAARRAPPGLQASVDDSIEEKVSRLNDAGVNQPEVIEAIREAVLRDVEDKVNDKAKELWQRGEKALSQLQQKHRAHTNSLAEEVARCHERQKSLEAENESLKKALADVAGRFAFLADLAVTGRHPSAGSLEGVVAAAGARAGAGASPTAVSQHAPEVEELGSAAVTPGQNAQADEGVDGRKLADVPPFPPLGTPLSVAGATPAVANAGAIDAGSSAPDAASVAPLLLSEVIGQQTPQRTPLSLASSLSPGTPEAQWSRAAVAAHAATGAPGVVFSFTLRKADGAELGLNVSHHENDKVLRVEGVRPDGAVEAWNRQCVSNGSTEKAVLAGDRIISVNSVVYDPDKMLEECRDRQLLRLTIVRDSAGAEAEGAVVAPSTTSPAQPATVLRADASVFVPMAAAPTIAAKAGCTDDTTETAAARV